jgi:Ca2+-binding RTX toxin-like protein
LVSLASLVVVAACLVSNRANAQCDLTQCEGALVLEGGCQNVIVCTGGFCGGGTALNDCYLGSAAADVIFDLVGGSDCVCGGGGGDIIFVGDGNDWVFGEDGADQIVGGPGADSIFGDGGNDTIAGDDGNDLLFGGAGDDTINGGADDDLLNGQDGADTLLGDDGVDSLFGGADNDQIFGGTGIDTLSGDDGNDVLEGGPDADTLTGGAGADLLRGDDGNDQLTGGSENDQLFGGAGADTLRGNDGNDVLDGGDGDDPLLDGGDGEDTIRGGAGSDTANGGPGIDFIDGGPDNDTLSGGDGPDIVNGDGGDDTLNGDAGNDRLDGGAGANSVFGNSGIDVCLNFIPPADPSCELLTHATLKSVSAFEEDGFLIVRWVTSSEAGTLGFYLLRERDGEWEALHEGLLPGLLHAPQGGVYDFRDVDGDLDETQRYLLVEVDVNGIQSTHGPFDVTPGSQAESLLDRDSGYARQAHQITTFGRGLKSAGSEKQRPGDAVAIYLGVEETGLYEISAAEIAARLGLDAGVARDYIRSGNFLLTEGGEDVAWMATDDGAALTFYGVERESLYTRERMYRLSLDAGTTMTAQSAAPGTVTDDLEYEGRLHLEENEIPGILVAQNPDEDYWFWQLISGAPALRRTASVAFELEAVTGDGTLVVDLHGISDEPHAVNVHLNGALLGIVEFEGVLPHRASFLVPLAALREGANALSIETTESDQSALYLNSADVTYARGYTTAAASLLFSANQGASVEVTGLTGNDIQLFDVTNPRRPVRLTDTVATPAGLELAVETQRQYFALAAGEARAPSSIWNDIPSDLLDRANAAEYLIIAAPELLDEAQQLADYREADGLVSKVIELQDIYDEFAFGTPDPNAIRAFLGYADEHWATAPDFVVLAGKGSFDYRDVNGAGGNLLPPIMALTHAGILSSDTKYADFIGDDGLPDVSIGRLPAKSAQELAVIIQQIIDYEALIDSLRDDVILLADATTRGGDFGASSDSITDALRNDWDVTAVYRSELGDLESTRALFFDEIRKAPRLVNYLGHASTESLGRRETLLGIEDLATMTIEGPQPVFAAMTCVASRFAAPGQVSLGEALLIDDQGAIAVWGPSGVSIHEQATLLARELLTELSSGSETRLGPMIDRALPVVADLELGRDMIEMYHLLGDPALRVVKANGSTGPGGSGGTPGAGGHSGNVGAGSSDGGGGCSVRWSQRDASSTWLLLLCALAVLVRKRNVKRTGRR